MYVLSLNHISMLTIPKPMQEFATPYPHACLYQLEVFLTPWLLQALEAPLVELGVDTELDWMLHCSVFKLLNAEEGFQ